MSILYELKKMGELEKIFPESRPLKTTKLSLGKSRKCFIIKQREQKITLSYLSSISGVTIDTISRNVRRIAEILDP